MKTTQKIPTIREFLGNLELGFVFLQTAGEQLCKMKADDFDVFDRIVEQCDWMTKDMLETLLLIGQKQIHPKIMLLPKHVYTKVCGLPYEEQERIVSGPVAVPPVSNGAGLRAEELEMSKSAKDLSRAESARVWGGGRHRQYSPLSPRMELNLAAEPMLKPAPATSRKPQVITLDEDGSAIVVFRQRVG